jgi:membrane protease subunit HflK
MSITADRQQPSKEAEGAPVSAPAAGGGPLPQRAGAPLRRRRRRSYAIGALMTVLLAAYSGSGFYVVNADQRAVVRRFGAVVEQVGPGMHYHLPWPVDRIDVVATTSVMKTGVGFILPEEGSGSASGNGMELLTGDTNILTIALVVQFVIRNPADFLFHVQSPRRLVDTVAQSVLTEAVATMPIDEVLTTGRVALQDQVKKQTQAVLDRYRSGLSVSSVNIMAMTLDRSVATAFQDVADAMADREKMRNEARAYENDLIPKARGSARMAISEAEAYRQQRVAEAVGDTIRFEALLKEYEKSPSITRSRLYLEAMKKILSKVKLYVLDSDNGKAPLKLQVRP